MSKKSLIEYINGFTLLEIIVAMLIISTLTAGILGSIIYADSIVREAALKIMAVNYARSALDKLNNYVAADYATLVTSFPDLATDNLIDPLSAGDHDSTTNLAICGLPAEYNGDLTYTVIDRDIDAIANNGNEYKEVTVTVSWDKP